MVALRFISKKWMNKDSAAEWKWKQKLLCTEYKSPKNRQIAFLKDMSCFLLVYVTLTILNQNLVRMMTHPNL